MENKADITVGRDAGAFARELDGFLQQVSRADSWQVERVLKRSDTETTEIVVRERAVDEAAPLRAVRKRIDGPRSSESAYEVLFRAQQRGVRIEGVPQIFECLRSGKTLHVLMEYIEGCPLDAFVAGAGAGPHLTASLMPELCRIVDELHARLDAPLIHRDLKPSNIIVRAGKPVVVDFGIARVWRADAEADTAHFVTRCYAPPEQFGFGQTDERSDVYALGKILFFCLSGAQPPNMCTFDACRAAGIAAPLATVIGRACSFDPRERYASAGELARATGEALAALPSADDYTPVTGGECVGATPTGDGHASGHLFACADECAEGLTVDAAGLMLGASATADARMTSSAAEAVDRAAHASVSGGRADPLGARGLPSYLEAARSSLSRLRVPAWVGVLWNTMVLCSYGLMVLGGTLAIVRPNAHDALLPPWFLILEYVMLCMVGTGAITLFLLDRRRLGVRFPLLARQPLAVELRRTIVIVVLSVLIPLISGMAAGIL